MMAKPESGQFAMAHTSRYHSLNAFWAWQFANLSYEDDRVVERIAREYWGFDRVEFLKPIETLEAVLAVNCELAMLAFRGSDEWMDWWVNLRADKVEMRGFDRVHAGFAEELAGLTIPVELGTQPLVITGHSKGGANAILYAAQRFDAGLPVASVWAFGSPRVFSREGARTYDRWTPFATHRVVINNDIVPRLPLRRVDYAHVGVEHYFNRYDELVDAPSWGYKLLDRIAGRFMGGLTDGAQDHTRERYQAVLSGQRFTDAEIED